MSLLSLILTAFAIGLSGAMTPGPLLSMVISNAAAGGFIAGLSPVLAHGMLEAVMVTALQLGLGTLLSQEVFRRVIAAVGGLALLYMGYGMWRSAASLEAPGKQGCDQTAGRPKGVSAGLLGGFVATGSSPFWFLWWATVGTSSISMGGGGALAASTFLAGHFSSDLVWYSLVCGAIVLGRKALSDKVYRNLIAACGVFLVGMGAFYVWNGLHP